MMSLSALQLDAFYAVARTLSFTRAARELHLTQSALSQRIKNLEEELSHLLFIRSAAGVTLTDAGHRLLRYCQTKSALESELVTELGAAPEGGLGGGIRVAAYSSVLRSAVLPALAPVLRAHPRLQVELLAREMGELVATLERGAADFVLLDRAHDRAGIEHVRLGEEELVLVESLRHDERAGVYLDHDPDDTTTQRFLRKNGKRSGWLARSFLDDIYGLIDGVAQGLGRAVVSRHLLSADLPVRVVPGLRPTRVPVILHHWRQPSYSRAQEAVREALVRGIPPRLI